MPAQPDHLIGVTELRNRIREVVDGARKGGRYTIVSSTEPVAVLVGVNEWRMLSETLDILLDRRLLKQISESEEAISKGRTRPAADVFAEIESGPTRRRRR